MLAKKKVGFWHTHFCNIFTSPKLQSHLSKRKKKEEKKVFSLHYIQLLPLVSLKNKYSPFTKTINPIFYKWFLFPYILLLTALSYDFLANQNNSIFFTQLVSSFFLFFNFFISPKENVTIFYILFKKKLGSVCSVSSDHSSIHFCKKKKCNSATLSQEWINILPNLFTYYTNIIPRILGKNTAWEKLHTAYHSITLTSVPALQLIFFPNSATAAAAASLGYIRASCGHCIEPHVQSNNSLLLLLFCLFFLLHLRSCERQLDWNAFYYNILNIL